MQIKYKNREDHFHNSWHTIVTIETKSRPRNAHAQKCIKVHCIFLSHSHYYCFNNKCQQSLSTNQTIAVKKSVWDSQRRFSIADGRIYGDGCVDQRLRGTLSWVSNRRLHRTWMKTMIVLASGDHDSPDAKSIVEERMRVKQKIW